MKKTLEDLKRFYHDRHNWRPPSYAKIMKFMGWKSKNSVKKALVKIQNEDL